MVRKHLQEGFLQQKNAGPPQAQRPTFIRSTGQQGKFALLCRYRAWEEKHGHSLPGDRTPKEAQTRLRESVLQRFAHLGKGGGWLPKDSLKHLRAQHCSYVLLQGFGISTGLCETKMPEGWRGMAGCGHHVIGSSLL